MADEPDIVPCPTCRSRASSRHCTSCGGTGQLPFSLSYLVSLADRLPRSRRREFQATHDGGWEQANEGDGFCAAAAYLGARDIFREPGTVIRGTRARSVVLETTIGNRLTLSGVEWGYSGEGPRVLAAVLTDLRIFNRFEDAKDEVKALPARGWKWSLVVPEDAYGPRLKVVPG